MGGTGDKYGGEEKLVSKTYRTETVRRPACIWEKNTKIYLKQEWCRKQNSSGALQGHAAFQVGHCSVDCVT